VADDLGRSTQQIGVWRQLALGLSLFGVYLIVDTLPGESRQGIDIWTSSER
jgi:hypothetical protein